jgi:hypothetical protein
MIDFLQVYSRATLGPLVQEAKFDREVFFPKVMQLTKKYDIHYDSDNLVSNNDALADIVFEAAVDLLAEVGLYCLDTQRIIEFSRDEILEAIREAPDSCWFGEGHDRGLFKPRKPDDPNPAWCTVGSGVATSTEEIAFKVVEGYARISEADSINAPCLSHLGSIPITGGSPVEIFGAIRSNNIAREALRQGGRPGLAIVNLIATASCATSTIAASQPNFGARPSDGWLVGFLAEMKIGHESLNKAAYVINANGSVGPTASPMLGGYCGGPEGTAITNAAYIIAGILVMKGSYHLSFPIDLNLGCSTSRKVLWAVGVSSQAISRNISYPFLQTGYVAAGPMTKNYFYEATAYLLTAIPSGASAQTPIPCKAVQVDHQTPLEMQFSAEVIRAAPKIDREYANDIVKRLLPMYEERLSSPPGGKPYQDCYDLTTGYPKQEYLDLYKRMKQEVADIGISFNH